MPAASVVGRRVAVLVESTEPGRALSKHLLGWPFFTAPSATADERLPGSGLLKKCILTLTAAATLSHLSPDVLIRADDGRDSLDRPGFPPACVAGRREVVVVDFADDGDETAEDDIGARLRAKARLGWGGHHPDPVVVPP